MREFVDKERKVEEKFHRVKGLLNKDINRLKEEIRKLIEEDPYYLEPYVMLNEIYEIEGDLKKAEEVLEEAYRRAMDLITKDGKIPDRLLWKHPTNRHIIKAILSTGIFYWEIGELEKALEIFRLLYRMDPFDEVGVRYYILAILMGMSFPEFEQVFSREGEYDYEDLERWFEKHAPDFPEEFRTSP